MTDCLEFLVVNWGSYYGVESHIAKLLEASAHPRIVDFGSGGGGPMRSLSKRLRRKFAQLEITLTDLYPNLHASQRKQADSSSESHGLSFCHQSVDMTNPPPTLSGVRTMFTSFHHLSPSAAQAAIENAVRAHTPLGIFETTGRTLAHWIMVFLIPIIILGITPFITPFRPGRYFATYIIPLVPLGCFWDGIVSNWRTYSVDDLHALTKDVASERYRFEIGKFSAGPLIEGTFLLGLPEKEGA